jgi:hypothetical protein
MSAEGRRRPAGSDLPLRQILEQSTVAGLARAVEKVLRAGLGAPVEESAGNRPIDDSTASKDGRA